MKQINPPAYTYSPDLGMGLHDPAKQQLGKIKSTINALGFALLLSVFLSTVASGVISRILSLFLDISVLENGQIIAAPQYRYFITMLSYFVQLLVPMAVYKKLIGVPSSKIERGNITALDFFTGVPILLALGVVGTTLSNAAVEVLSQFGIYYATSGSPIDNIITFLFSVLTLAVIPSIVEELVFRGLVQQSLSQFGTRFAILGSALMFALAHFSLVKFINAFFIGLFLSYLAYKTGGLALGMILHFINNFLSLLINLASHAGNVPPFVMPLVYATMLLLGIISIMVLAKKDRHAFDVHDTDYTNTLSVKIKTACKCSGFVMSVAVVVYVMLNNGRV